MEKVSRSTTHTSQCAAVHGTRSTIHTFMVCGCPRQTTLTFTVCGCPRHVIHDPHFQGVRLSTACNPRHTLSQCVAVHGTRSTTHTFTVCGCPRHPIHDSHLHGVWMSTAHDPRPTPSRCAAVQGLRGIRFRDDPNNRPAGIDPVMCTALQQTNLPPPPPIGLSPSLDLMLAQRRRRWASIKSTLGEPVWFAGSGHPGIASQPLVQHPVTLIRRKNIDTDTLSARDTLGPRVMDQHRPSGRWFGIYMKYRLLKEPRSALSYLVYFYCPPL